MPVLHPDKAREYVTVLRHNLLGRRYYGASRALEVMLSLHGGLRKDGVTPEWAHPALVTLHLFTLDGAWPDGTQDDLYAAALLHDTLEDKPLSAHELKTQADLSDRALDTVIGCSRKFAADGTRLSNEAYYAGMLERMLCPAVKLGDRVQNFDTMIGVFTPEKQLKYMQEVTDHILPMAKLARRRYPECYQPLQNLTGSLKGQMNMLAAIHGQ